MSGSMMELKDQLAQVSRGTTQSLESGPTFIARIPDLGLAANAPRFPTGWVRCDEIVTPSEPAIASVVLNTQYVNVEIPVNNTAYNIPSASQPMRAFAVQDTMMQGIGGTTFQGQHAVTQSTFGTTLQGQPTNVQSSFGSYVPMQQGVNARNFASSSYTIGSGDIPQNAPPQGPPNTPP